VPTRRGTRRTGNIVKFIHIKILESKIIFKYFGANKPKCLNWIVKIVKFAKIEILES
jgi:hypothetical protein